MPLLPIVVALVFLLVVLLILDDFPGDAKIKLIIRVVLLLGFLVWLLQRYPL